MTEKSKSLPQLPKGWVWTRLKDICETTSGGTPSRKIKSFFDGSIPWLKSGELDNKIINSAEESITKEGLMKSSAKLIPKGTLLIALYGATAGKLGILEIDAAINQAICAVSPYNGVSRNFLFWHLIQHRSELLNARKGGAQPNISQEIVRDILIPLAPFPEQGRIVGKVEELFTKLDAGLESLKQIKAQLQSYRHAVLKHAFEGELTKEWREAHKDEIEHSSVLLKHIQEERRHGTRRKYKEIPPLDTSDLPKLPENWVWTRVGEISEMIQYGTSEKAGKDPTGIPVIRMGNIHNGKLDFDDLKYFPTEWPRLRDFVLQDGDVLFNRTNSAELVGKTAVYKKHHPRAVFASYLIRVRTNKNTYDPDILAFFINSFYGRKYIASVVSQQVGQANVNGTKLSLMPIPLIPPLEQGKIMEEVERSFSVTNHSEEVVEQSLRQAERLRQSILKKAFEGKLVPQDPTDEPAKKLLERIKEERESSPKQMGLMQYVK